MDALFRPVTNKICSMPFWTSSSTTYCTIGFRATGSISLGWDLVAGSSRVPTPATGTIALLITTRLYLMEGKEKANGRSRTARGTAAQDCPHRSQVRWRHASAATAGAIPPRAPRALLRRGDDERQRHRQCGRRALPDRKALPQPPPPRQHGHFQSHRAARRPARFALRRNHPALAPQALGVSRHG